MIVPSHIFLKRFIEELLIILLSEFNYLEQKVKKKKKISLFSKDFNFFIITPCETKGSLILISTQVDLLLLSLLLPKSSPF